MPRNWKNLKTGILWEMFLHDTNNSALHSSCSCILLGCLDNPIRTLLNPKKPSSGTREETLMKMMILTVTPGVITPVWTASPPPCQTPRGRQCPRRPVCLPGLEWHQGHRQWRFRPVWPPQGQGRCRWRSPWPWWMRSWPMAPWTGWTGLRSLNPFYQQLPVWPHPVLSPSLRWWTQELRWDK